MIWKKTVRAAAAVLLASAGVLLLLFLQYLADGEGEPDPVSKVQTMMKDLYNGYGLEGDRVLSDTRIYEDDQIVCYEDRLFYHFNYPETGIERLAGQMEEIKRRCPKLEGLYVLPVPLRIFLENGYQEDKKAYSEYLELLSGSMPEGVSVVDVLPDLEAHSDEYLFFRTEDSWTAKGAYYGSVRLCDALGLEPFSLDAYHEYMYNSFTGTLYQLNKGIYENGRWLRKQTEDQEGDRVFYYLLPDSSNQAELFTIKDEEVTSRKQPAISPASKGLSTFIGDNYFWAVVKGDKVREETEDKTLLLVCDVGGKILAPFMAGYYDNVYVVDVARYGEFAENITEILQEYNITDFVLAQSPLYMGNSSYSWAMSGFESDEN